MKQAILGLRKRESYEELINDLNHDLITNYPDRRASELENSPYLSQLRGGFEEMIMHNDNLMKEKMKEMLLHEEAGKADVGRHELSIQESRWRPHVPPEPEGGFYTPERPAPAPDPLRAPVGQPTTFAPNRPDIEMSETRGSRTAKNRNQPVAPGPETYNIGSPLNSPRGKNKGRKGKKNNLAHDVDAHVEEAHEIAVDDAEMQQQRQEELKERSKEMARAMLEASQNRAVDNLMPERKDKRREEGANPMPAKPKARQTKPKREAEEEPVPGQRKKKQPATEPEDQHEPKGPRGRPKGTQASSSTDIPQAAQQGTPIGKALAKAKAAAAKTKAAPETSKPIPVKKTIEQKGIVIEHYATIEEWDKNNNKGSLVNQYNLRPGIGEYLRTRAQVTKITKRQLITNIMDFDKKHKTKK